jgi:hypothetical protein
MKLYGDFVKEDWLKAFKMAEHDVPSSMIINGAWDHNKILTKWEKTFESSTCAPHWNTIVGTIGHQQIGFANVFGGPSAAVITHQSLRISLLSLGRSGSFKPGISVDWLKKCSLVIF